MIVRLCIESADKTEDANGDYPLDVFVDIADGYFDSTNQLPAGVVAWTKVLSAIDGGKIKKSNPTYTREGKNVGKTNATNCFTQALRDGLGKYNKQKAKSGATEATDGPNDTKLFPCMLAQPLNDQKNFNWNQALFAQVKFNGVRAVATKGTGDTPVIYSRTRKIYNGFAYWRDGVVALLKAIEAAGYPGAYLDGEAYSHGKDLQLISGTARRELDGTVNPDIKLEYHIYDMFLPAQPDLTFSQRNKILQQAFGLNNQYLRLVETIPVANLEEVNLLYSEALDDKYEGVMVRLDAPYDYSYNDYHSKRLLKVKPVNDAEYKIVGFSAGTNGKAEQALIFELITPAGIKFSVVPGMELVERKKLYARMQEVDPVSSLTHFQTNYEGKKLTILYDELSSDGVPVRARTVGIVVRDYE